MRKGTRPRWDRQIPELRRLWEAGLSAKDIGTVLGRSAHAVNQKAAALMLAKRPAIRAEVTKKEGRSKPKPDTDRRQRRACLGCRKPFPSDGPHNRLCKSCRKHADENQSALDVAM